MKTRLSHVLSGVNFAAGSALASTAFKVKGVCLVVLVAMFAMSLSAVLSCWTNSAETILFNGDSLEVNRIDTGTVSAEVINDHAFRDRSLEKLVRESMGLKGITQKSKHAVTKDIISHIPVPAPRLGYYNLTQQNIFNCFHDHTIPRLNLNLKWSFDA